MRHSEFTPVELKAYMWVALGSAVGGCARFAVGSAITAAAVSGTVFPWGTFLINIAGSLLIGVFASLLEDVAWRQLLMAGLCGGFTTFSSFSLETVNLLRQGHTGQALAYVGGSILLCLAAVWAGHAVGSALR